MGDLRRDPVFRLQSCLRILLDQNNSSVVIIATEVTVAHDPPFPYLFSALLSFAPDPVETFSLKNLRFYVFLFKSSPKLQLLILGRRLFVC